MKGNRAQGLRRVALVAAAVVLALGVALCMTACGSSNSNKASKASGDTFTFKDSCGREVTVPSKIERVAVTGPVGQMIMLTLAPEKMVGFAVQLDAEPAKYLGNKYDELPVYGQIYGGKGTLNKEALASAEPQVIIDLGEAKDTIVTDMDDLQDTLGIPCVHIETGLDVMGDAYTQLGDLLNKEDRAKELADYCNSAYKTVSEALKKVDDADKPNALYVVGDKGTSVIAKGSFQSRVFDMMCNNLAVVDNPSAKGTGNEVDMEQIALWDPEFIVFGVGSIYDTVATTSEWQNITAVVTGNYVEDPGVPYTWLSNPPGVNTVLGMQWLSHLLYPDLFSDSLKDVVTGYAKTFFGYEMGESEYQDLMKNATLD